MNARDSLIRLHILERVNAKDSAAGRFCVYLGGDCCGWGEEGIGYCELLLYSYGRPHYRYIRCDCCYQKLLSLLPMRTFLERIYLFPLLEAVEVNECFIHPFRVPNISDGNMRGCCTECLKVHVRECGEMTRRYLLVGCMRLPCELGREIMWFAVRV